MATIRKKGPFQWHCQIRRKGYPPQTQTFNTKADAETWARGIESEMDRGVFVSRTEAEQTTFAQICYRYEQEILPTKKGVISDISRLKRLKDHFGRYSLATINSSLIAEYRDLRLKEVGPQSVRHELGLMNRIFKSAVLDWGIALPSGIPTAQIRKPSAPPGRERRILTVTNPVTGRPWTEIDAISAASSSLDLPIIVCLAVETAMRRSEIAGLEWSRVKLEERHIVLKKGETKNDEGREVPLSSVALTLLKKLPHRIDGKVFGLQPGSITQAFTRARKRARLTYEDGCKAAGMAPNPDFLVDLRIHDHRHEATSRLYERTDMRDGEIAAITGHKDTSMLRRYTHLRGEELAKKMW